MADNNRLQGADGSAPCVLTWGLLWLSEGHLYWDSFPLFLGGGQPLSNCCFLLPSHQYSLGEVDTI